MPHAPLQPDTHLKLIAAAVIATVTAASLFIMPSPESAAVEHQRAPLAAATPAVDARSLPAAIEPAGLRRTSSLPTARVPRMPALAVRVQPVAPAPAVDRATRDVREDVFQADLPAAPLMVSALPAPVVAPDGPGAAPLRRGAVTRAVSLAGRHVGVAFRRAGGAFRSAF